METSHRHHEKHKTHPVKFSIIQCTGEESGYPVTELQYYTDNTKGWLSPRFCDYPQEMVLQFHHHCRMLSKAHRKLGTSTHEKELLPECIS